MRQLHKYTIYDSCKWDSISVKQKYLNRPPFLFLLSSFFIFSPMPSSTSLFDTTLLLLFVSRTTSSQISSPASMPSRPSPSPPRPPCQLRRPLPQWHHHQPRPPQNKPHKFFKNLHPPLERWPRIQKERP